MPNARSTLHYNSPRSPAPPVSTARPFQSPSYYAVAGGLSPRNATYRDGGIHIKPQTNQLGRQHPEPPSDSESLRNTRMRGRSQRSNAHSEIPRLETRLLPTLRDTIDRMTGLPSRPAPPFKAGFSNEANKQHRNSHSRRSSPDIAHKQSSSRVPSTPQPSRKTPGHQHSSPLSTPLLKEPVKSALKSAFRSPMPVTASPAIPPSPLIAGTSLKSMKNLLSRKYSGTLKSPFNNNKRKDTEQIGMETPLSPSQKKTPQSNIPRPRTRYYNNDPARFEDSDLEHRYEADLRDRRRLTVTNGEVSLSGSSSISSDADEQYADNHTHNTYPLQANRNRNSSFGLGLFMRQSEHVSARTPRQGDVCPNPPEKNLRFSLPISESDGSRYSNESNAFQVNPLSSSSVSCYGSGTDSNNRTYSFKDIRSSQELRISSDDRRSSPVLTRTTHSPTLSKSAYSQDSMDEEDVESERDGYSIRRSRRKGGRRRSSSCEPNTFGSETDSDGVVPIISRRSHSASRRQTPSPRTSRIFPNNLHKLIKSRNSFTEPLSGGPKDGTLWGGRKPTPRNYSNPRDTDIMYGEPEQPLQDRSPEYCSRAGEGSSTHPNTNKRPSEAMSVVENYRSAAARERNAFGIPASISDEIFNRAAEEQLSDSNVASGDRTMWQDGSPDLTDGSESIIATMQYEDHRQRKVNQRTPTTAPGLSIISPTQSATSMYSEARPRTAWDPQESMSRYTDETTPKARGVVPLPFTDGIPPEKEAMHTREGVMQEIFETEEELLRLFRICLRVFILPLRIQNSKAWIAGIPPNVAKLLDWFDDIVRLHEEIYQSLCLARDTMTPTTDRVSEFLRCFVLNAEVYQPYLVRLSDVSEEITTLTDAHNNDLGQFIAIQQRLPECEGWTLERLLMMPINRLAAYQDLFAQMLDRTPKAHQDYLSTYSLSRSTDMVIRVMTEVKMREDEHKLLKVFSSRVRGLPSPTELATRERRLIHSGPLALVTSDLECTFKERSSSWHQNIEATRAKRASKLMDAIHSVSSATVFDKADSVSSQSTRNSFGSNIPTTSTPVKSSSSSWFSRLPLGKRSAARGSKPPTVPISVDVKDQTSAASSPALRTTSVHAFIFNDLVLMAQPNTNMGKASHWTISEDVGVFRPLSIAHIQSRDEGTVISLESMTLDLEHLNDHADFRTASYRTVDFFLPRSPMNASELPENTWLLAFRKCCTATLRKLTFPGVDQSEDAFNLSDRAFDTHAAVSSLVASGLPIPRSPSGTFPDMRGGLGSTFTGDEREERGWWSLRYRQVFREFQRQDSLLSNDDENSI